MENGVVIENSEESRRLAKFSVGDDDEDKEPMDEARDIPERLGATCSESRKIYIQNKSMSLSTESEDSGVRTQTGPGSASSSEPPSRKISFFSSSKRIVSKVFDTPTFDQLFETMGEVKLGLHQPCTFTVSGKYVGDMDVEEDVVCKLEEFQRQQRSASLRRRDSVMQLTFPEMLHKGWQASKNFYGFRRRTATDISHKYCSYCRCEDTLFLFLHVVFGIILVCVGTLGYLHCPEELLVVVFLTVDGLLCVFIFPTTIMEWPKHVGGCIPEKEEKEKAGKDVFWPTVMVLRLVAACTGTVIVSLHIQKIYTHDFICSLSVLMLLSSVLVEWAFMIFIIVCPLCFFGILYCISPKVGKTWRPTPSQIWKDAELRRLREP